MWQMIIPAVIGGIASNSASKRASSAANRAANQADQLEREKFAEAKKQAEILRQRGDEASAVALEEAAKAELGAEKFEALSNYYADQVATAYDRREGVATDLYNDIRGNAERRETVATDIYNDIRGNADRRETIATDLYNRIGSAADARQAAGSSANDAIMAEAGKLTEQARLGDARQTAAFGNIQDRYTPFMESERQAIGQLGAEMGLSPGEQFTGYRDSPAYMAAQDASRVAQEESINTINQDSAISGSLYSGSRGAALSDRAGRGSYERAGIEQSYYQNYMNMLQQMANPASTGVVSNFEAGTARNITGDYMNAAGTSVNAAVAGQNMKLNSMRTGEEGAHLINNLRTGAEGAHLIDNLRSGAEGANLINYLNPGDGGANYALGGLNTGTAGSPYRLGAQDYRIQGAGGSGSMVLNNMPTGDRGSEYRLAGVKAQNDATADFVGGMSDVYANYLKYGNPNTPRGTTPPINPTPPANAGNRAWNNFYGGY